MALRKATKSFKGICCIIMTCMFCYTLASCSGAGGNGLQPAPGLPYYEDMPDLTYAKDRAGMKEVQIEGDGSIPPYRFEKPKPYFDENGMTMFPMAHFGKLFGGNIRYETDGGKTTITKDVLGVLTVVSVEVGSNILIRDGQEILMATTPVQEGGTIYIPLEYVGHALGYGVFWNERLQCVKFYQYTSVYVYVWNEREDSSPGGLMYSYIISGDYATDMQRVMVNATREYPKVREVLDRLPGKARVLATNLYRVKGYTVPNDVFESMTSGIFASGLGSSYAKYCLDEIPPIIKDLHGYANDWYSQELYALDEEALYGSKGHIYRLSCYPAFDDTVVVRVEIRDDGAADVYYKASDGIASQGDGNGVADSGESTLGKDETRDFLMLLDDVDYWNLPMEIDSLGLDGHEIVIEGVKDGEYHIVDRWTPEEDDPVHRLEEYFLNLVWERFWAN